jgi:hypothetical protein
VVCRVGCNCIPPCIPDGHPHTVTNTRCRTDSYFSWWWAQSCPKHVENRNKHTRKELCTRLVLFTRLYNDARSTKHKRKDNVMVQMLGPHLRSEMNRTETLCGEVIYSYRHLKTIFIAVVLDLLPTVTMFMWLGGRWHSMQISHRSREHVFDVSSLVCEFPLETKDGVAS